MLLLSQIGLVSISCILITSATPSLTSLEGERSSLKPRLSVPDFVLQLWRKSDFLQSCETKSGEPGFEAMREDLACETTRLSNG